MEWLWVALFVFATWAISAVLKGIGGDKQEEQIQKLTIRIREERLDKNDSNSLKVKCIEGKGLFPHTRKANISFITSLLDQSADGMPMLCPVNNFQESDTNAYQFTCKVGEAPPGSGFNDWNILGQIFPVLIPPHGGKRKLAAILRMVDADNPPNIIEGRADPKHPGLLWQEAIMFDWTYDGKGYEDEAQHRDESRALSLKIAMAVAMADGSLDSTEGNLMKQWITRKIAPYEGEERERLKILYNDALRESYAAAKRNALNLDPLTRRLNEIGEKPIKYETMELCFDVMSADGVAHKAEMEILNHLGDLLELDMREIESMRDKTVIKLRTDFSDSSSAKNLLGIDPNWSEEQIKKHLRNEFAKWNNRLETLPAGAEQDNAQNMLNLIVEERKKRNVR